MSAQRLGHCRVELRGDEMRARSICQKASGITKFELYHKMSQLSNVLPLPLRANLHSLSDLKSQNRILAPAVMPPVPFYCWRSVLAHATAQSTPFHRALIVLQEANNERVNVSQCIDGYSQL